MYVNIFSYANIFSIMSKIGRNIKKIRSVKNLSQSKFADLFKLSRASIGSYEEERAEPKIEKLIEIANYFSIKLEDLLKKELSVNEISGFDKTSSSIYSESNNLLKNGTSKKVDFIKKSKYKLYLDGQKLHKNWTKTLELPPNIDEKTEIAIEQYDNSMYEKDNGISMDDILFGYEIEFSQINNSYIYVIFTNNNYYTRKVLLNKSDKLELIAINRNFEPISLNKSEISKVFRVSGHIKGNINHFINE